MQKRLGKTTDRISPATFRDQQVSTLGRREPVAVPEDTSLADAMTALHGGATRSVLVTGEDGRLVGVFTERDIVVRILGAHPPADPSRPIREYMTAPPEALHLDSPLGDALALMEQRGYHGLPIVDSDGRVAGHLDDRDVLEFIAEAFPQEILNLPPRPHQQMEQAEGA